MYYRFCRNIRNSAPSNIFRNIFQKFVIELIFTTENYVLHYKNSVTNAKFEKNLNVAQRSQDHYQ